MIILVIVFHKEHEEQRSTIKLHTLITESLLPNNSCFMEAWKSLVVARISPVRGKVLNIASIAKLSVRVLHIDINSRHAAATWQVTQSAGQCKGLVGGHGFVYLTYNRNKVPCNAIRNS